MSKKPTHCKITKKGSKGQTIKMTFKKPKKMLKINDWKSTNTIIKILPVEMNSTLKTFNKSKSKDTTTRKYLTLGQV